MFITIVSLEMDFVMMRLIMQIACMMVVIVVDHAFSQISVPNVPVLMKQLVMRPQIP